MPPCPLDPGLALPLVLLGGTEHLSMQCFCETDEVTVIICCTTKTVEAQRGQATGLWPHSGSVPSLGTCLSLSCPQRSLLSSTLHWVNVDLFPAAQAGMRLLGPCQQAEWSVPCTRPSLRFCRLTSLFTIPPSQGLSRSQQLPHYFSSSPMCQCDYHLIVIICEAGLQVSLRAEAQRQHQIHPKPHSSLPLRLVFPSCSRLFIRAEGESTLEMPFHGQGAPLYGRANRPEPPSGLWMATGPNREALSPAPGWETWGPLGTAKPQEASVRGTGREKSKEGLCWFWQRRLGPTPGRTVTQRSAALTADSPTTGFPCAGCPPAGPFNQPTESHRLPRSQGSDNLGPPQPLPLASRPAGSSPVKGASPLKPHGGPGQVPTPSTLPAPPPRRPAWQGAPRPTVRIRVAAMSWGSGEMEPGLSPQVCHLLAGGS